MARVTATPSAVSPDISPLREADRRRLHSIMNYRGVSVRTLASKSGVCRSTIGHLRSGKRNTCEPRAAKRISKALDVPTEALFVDLNAERVVRNSATKRRGRSYAPAAA